MNRHLDAYELLTPDQRHRTIWDAYRAGKRIGISTFETALAIPSDELQARYLNTFGAFKGEHGMPTCGDYWTSRFALEDPRLQAYNLGLRSSACWNAVAELADREAPMPSSDDEKVRIFPTGRRSGESDEPRT